VATSTVRVLFLGDSASAVRSVNTLNRSLGGLDRASSLAGRALAVGIVGGLVAATKAAVDFDRGMRNVNTLTKLSEARFQALSKQVLGLSKETGKAPKDLAKGLYDIVSSGFKANDAIKILRVSAKAATAGLTDTATATKAINAALNAYHLEAEDARKVSDILFQTVNKGVLTFEELAQNMGDLVPAAAPLGVTLEEVGAAIATITLQGVPAAEAATRVKNTMLQLASPSKALAGLLKEQGFASGEAAIKSRGFVGVLELLQKATGGSVTETAKLTPEIRALLGIVGLTGKNLEIYERNLRSMDTAQRGSGASAKAFAEQGKSIGVQWDRAKAALTAAAIPLGQQLFPLLTAGAGKVEDFAEALPRLQQQLSPLGSAIREVGGALQFLGSHSEGQAAIVGLVTAVSAAKIAGGLRNLALGIGGLASPAGLAVTAVGLLAGALFYTATRSDQLASSLANLKSAMAETASAEETLARTQLRSQQTATQLEAAELTLTQSRREAAATLREYGRNSEEYRGAALRVAQAEQSVKQSHLDRKTSAKDVQRAEQALADSSRTSAGAIEDAYDKANAALKRAEGSVYSTSQASQQNLRPVIAVFSEFGTAIFQADRAAGNAVGSAKEYRSAVIALGQALGRLPTVKEIRINVRIQQYGRSVPGGTPTGIQNRAQGGFIHYDAGGIVPHVPGSTSGVDSVMAMVTPGEIVLNRGQQETLGGPRFLAQLFGFSGERGMHFAAGGIVPRGAGGSGRRPPPRRRYPHRSPRQRPYSKVTKAARFAFRAAENVGRRIEDLDRSYGQLQREFSISPEEAITYDADGNEILDSAAVSKHMNEIGRLIIHRQRMLGLLDEEKAKLEEAIEALRKAIAELMAEMNREREAAEADARQARALAQSLNAAEREEQDLRDQKPKTTKAKKERDAAVRRSEREQDRLRGRIDGSKKSEQKHLNKRRALGSLKDDLASNVGSARSLQHDIPFDRRDVDLDVMELMQEASEWAAFRAQPGFGGDAGGGGEGDGGGGGVGGIDEEALRRLGMGRLAAAIEIAQLKVIGSFAKGTIHVPQTGLALVHAGERITPAGVPNVNAETGPVIVQISSDDTLLGELLSRAIDVGVVRNTGEINARIGNDADRRRREGRYG